MTDEKSFFDTAPVPDPPPLAEDEREFLSDSRFRWATGILFLYFAGRLVFYAVSISGYVPPDEVTHLGISKVFSKVPLLPGNTPETYGLGLVTNIPWLYYWVMGKLLLLNIFGISDLVFLRLLNIPLAFGTVWFGVRTLRLLTPDRLSRLLLLAVLTNIPMFTFLSASVSYDNLTNLLAAMAIYYLLAFFRDRSPHYLAGSLACQLAGCLTKTTFLPLALILNLLLLFHGARNFRAFGRELPAFLQGRKRLVFALGFALLLGAALNLQLYGGNFLRYKKLAPDVATVLSPEIALKNRISARDTIFGLYQEGRISSDEATTLAATIDHPGDRADAIDLVRNYERHLSGGEPLLSPGAYVLPWTQQMLSGIFGIAGHRSMYSYWLTNLAVVLLMALTAVAVAIRWRPLREGALPSLLAVVPCLYGLFLMYGVNYRIYRETAYFPLAVQGRYLFPVIGAISAVCCYYLLRLFRGRYLRLLLACVAATVFIASDFPFFLSHATPEWFL